MVSLPKMYNNNNNSDSDSDNVFYSNRARIILEAVWPTMNIDTNVVPFI